MHKEIVLLLDVDCARCESAQPSKNNIPGDHVQAWLCFFCRLAGLEWTNSDCDAV
jgi:hypothetical protein